MVALVYTHTVGISRRYVYRPRNSDSDIQVINRCRLYLQIERLSDICPADGLILDPNIFALSSWFIVDGFVPSIGGCCWLGVFLLSSVIYGGGSSCTTKLPTLPIFSKTTHICRSLSHALISSALCGFMGGGILVFVDVPATCCWCVLLAETSLRMQCSRETLLSFPKTTSPVTRRASECNESTGCHFCGVIFGTTSSGSRAAGTCCETCVQRLRAGVQRSLCGIGVNA
jgi:hypothetical protein